MLRRAFIDVKDVLEVDFSLSSPKVLKNMESYVRERVGQEKSDDRDRMLKAIKAYTSIL